MTKESLAALLDGREYGHEFTREEAEQAKAAGLVVVYGASDDLTEFRGAINDEAGFGTLYLSADGLFPDDEFPVRECDECKYFKLAQAACRKIDALWCVPDSPTWTYKTDIPHATFNIVEDGEPYCRGIVFSVEDLR